jgi:glycosyltransferase involved in cell wall biosynthesis
MDDAYLALLEGIERVVQTHEALQFFFDGRRSDQHQVWKTARKMDLLPHLSFVPRKVGQREVLLLADGLIHPKAQGRSRGLTLMAMAHGLPVLSPDDPLLDYLIDSRTARVLAEPTAEQWALAIHDLISLPDTARGLGQSAREWVQDHRLASDQIERVLSLYRHATGQPLAQLS